uniref:Uncharacterized protein n=1 Tax=Onchocerca volvulus TaxID=6282 RepID=A0A8R1TL45_ONCVO
MPIPSPAHIFSGSSVFNLSERNRISAIAQEMNRSSNLRSNNSTFSLSLQKSTSISVYYNNKQPSTSMSPKKSVEYQKEEELKNKFFNAPKIINISTNKAMFRPFQYDNFDENYQRINETYFSQGINLEENNVLEPYIQVFELEFFCMIIFSIFHAE